MSWKYTISTGTIFDLNDQPAGHGYAGHQLGLNNPAMTGIKNVGPLPQGTYTIGPAIEDHQVGVFALPLTPASTNNMFGRADFFIHGDNPGLNHTASDGCIIMARPIRELIAGSGDTELDVYATYNPAG